MEIGIRSGLEELVDLGVEVDLSAFSSLGIDVAHRVVADIGVAIPTLRESGISEDRIDTEESTRTGGAVPGMHVVQHARPVAAVPIPLVAGKLQLHLVLRRIRRLAAKRVVAVQRNGKTTLVGDLTWRPEVVEVQVRSLLTTACCRLHGRQ